MKFLYLQTSTLKSDLGEEAMAIEIFEMLREKLAKAQESVFSEFTLEIIKNELKT